MIDISYIKTKLYNTNNIVILSHKNPDGDSIGSSLALYNFLKNIGNNCDIIFQDMIPDNLSWLPDSNSIIIYNNENFFTCKEKILKANILFFLDLNSYSRVENLYDLIIMNSNTLICIIDHHENCSIKYHFSYIDTKSSSTCELIYNFIDYVKDTNDIWDVLDINICTYLYTGIMTDTYNFRYNTSYKTHLIISKLLKKGIKNEIISSNIYDNLSINSIKIFSYCIDNMQYIYNYNVCIMYIPKYILDKYNYKEGDLDGIVNYGLKIKNCKISILLKEFNDNNINISLRSKKNICVQSIAKKYFSGGGHKNASGGVYKGNLENCIVYIKKLLYNML